MWFLYIITACVVFITLCILFEINYEYKGKWFEISIKTTRNKK